HDRGGAEVGDQRLVAPLWPELTAVEDEVTRRDNRVPVDRRLTEFGASWVIGNRIAIVIVAVGHHRPAVVHAALDPIDFVAAAGAMFKVPKLPVEIEGEAE